MSREPDPSASNPTLRLFIAAQLPAAAQQAAAAALARLRAENPGGWRWVRPEALHLTLRFLGETPTEWAPAATAAMRRAAASSPPLELALNGAGVFGGRRPRVLWLGLAGDLDGLQALAARLAAGRTLALSSATSGEPFATTAAQLIRSRLRPSGAEYSTLASAQLGGAVL